jgi:serine/threonine-protein kinase
VLGAERFLREIGIAARLSHPHILPLHDSGTLDLGLGRPVLFYVMPYVAGHSLRERLREELQLPLDEALGIARQVADALDHAHREGVIHRDIKPENILLSDGQAVLADFGIARALDSAGGEPLTDAGLTIGTPAYMSPEQSTGSVRLDGRSDIYSLGCVVYEMLGGQPPFPGPTPQAILARHAMDPVPSLRTLRPGVPRALAQVVTRAMAKVPSDRFPTARAFADALADAPLVEDPAPPSSWRRPRGLVALVIGLAIGAAGVAAVFARRPESTAASQPPGVPQAEEQRSIAVLPLVNLTPGPKNESLSDGITDELIDQLSRVEGLRVAPRASAFTFKGTSPDPREVGQKLHVAAVLDGSVQVSGGKVRVYTELVSARDGRRVWFDVNDLPLTDAFTVQDKMARGIRGPIELWFATSTASATESRSTRAQEARKLYLKGRSYFSSFDTWDRQLAVQYFHKAVERDSSSALAWAGLADGYSMAGDDLPPQDSADVRNKARTAARRAVALDSTLTEAHAAIGFQYELDWEWESAERSLRRAIALSPGNALAHRWYSVLLTVVGRYPEAVAEAERAEGLDPSNPFMILGTVWACTSARQYERAAAADLRWQKLDPTSEHNYTTIGRMQFLEGKQSEGLANLERGAQLEEAIPYSLNALRLAWAYAAAGQHEKARRTLRGVQREPGRAWPPSYAFAAVYAALGDRDSAFDWLERAYAARENEIETIGAMPELDPLRGDPRFTSLLRRMRIPT